jgi:hypothetical protein
MGAHEHLNLQEFTPEQVGSAYSTEYDSPVFGVERDVEETDREAGNPGRLDSLAADIRESGIRTPLQVLAPVPGEEPEPMLVDGHHRYVAGVRAGVKSFPVNVHHPVVSDDGPDWPTFYR